MNISLVYFFFNNSECSKNNFLDSTKYYKICNQTTEKECCSILNYTNRNYCINSNYSNFTVSCFNTFRPYIDKKPNMIIVYSTIGFCIFICLCPIILKIIEYTREKIYKKKYKKYKAIHTTIVNPCYDPSSV